MPVKRSLKLDGLLKANIFRIHKSQYSHCDYKLLWKIVLHDVKSFDSPKITRKKSITSYSPTTGTCQMSPFASPTSFKEQEHKNGPSNGRRKTCITKRKESTTQDNDEFMVLLSKVEKSSEEIIEVMQNALEGSRELENLIGISRASCVLKREMQKTKELMTKVTKQKLFEKKSSGLPKEELCHLDSYEFLKTILN
ncbi:centromere protein R isoform X2 [Camelus ferus]|uniref:Centromere protein R isoform X2 n=1 Tax=Camelus ferus TaxID=419612 RepID=A0A8B8U7Z6_CAMFR|nr:centromere protein R isoform X2 [Camelus ferus]